MKTIFNLTTFLILLVINSCNKANHEKIPNQKTSYEVELTKKLLIGEWYNPNYIEGCDTCEKFIFFENGTIAQISPNESLQYSYIIFKKDSISVTRNWEIEPNKKHTKHKMNINNNDSIIIENFIAVDFGTTDFVELLLIKNIN